MWQLKTSPIKKIEEDQLSHNVIAELLENKLKHLFSKKDIPSCICLSGDYGSGKSTIINFLIEKMNGKSNTKLIFFNAWRHKNENMHYALFRNIFYTLNNKNEKDFTSPNFLDNLSKSGELEALDKEFSELVYSSVSNKVYTKETIFDDFNNFVSKDYKKYFPVMIKLIGKTVLWISLIVTALVFGIKFGLTKDLVLSLEYSFNSFMALIFSSTLITLIAKENMKLIPKLIEFNIKPNEKTTSLPNINNTEQLQILYRKILNKYLNKDYNYIIIVEDIDRKHYDEIINSLNDLRTFIDLGKAIFLIPCDIKNIEQAFKEKAINKGETNAKELTWRARDFCNKMFSHIVTIPPQDKQDLRILLKNKINLELPNHPINKYLKENTLVDLIDILIVSSIKTPREAINIFNRFTLQFEYSLKLEKEGKRLKPGTISNNILKYARIYVLSNYYNLEKELLQNPKLLEWIICKFRNNQNIIPNYAKDYIDTLYEKMIITEEIEEFVSRTENYSSNLIKPFIYLDETSYSGLLGNKFYLEIFELLRNRSTNNLINKLNLNKLEVSEIISKIIKNISYSSDYKSIVPTLIDINLFLDIKYQKKISRFIAEHLHSVNLKNLYGYDAKTIFKISNNLYENKKIKFRNIYLEILDSNDLSEFQNEEKIFEICLETIRNFKKDQNFVSKDTILKIKNLVKLPLNDSLKEKRLCLELLNETINLDSKLIKNIFSFKVLSRIINNIDQNNFNLSNKAIEQISSYYLQNNLNINEVLEELELLVKSKKSNHFELYLSLINKNLKFFILKTSKEKILNTIFNEILKDFFAEDRYDSLKNIIMNSIKIIAKLDGELYKIGPRNPEVFTSLNQCYSDNISSTKNIDFLEFNLKMINLHEANAHYLLGENLSPILLAKMDSNLSRTENIDEFNLCKLIAGHFILNNRLIDLDDKHLNLLRDIIMNKLKTLVQSNNANTLKSEYIYEILKILTESPNFNQNLGQWISEKGIVPNISQDLNFYSNLFKIYELSEKYFSDSFLNNLYNNLFYNISNYPTNLDFSLKAWEWLYKLSVNYPTNPNFKILIDHIFNNFNNREAYFKEKIKLEVVKLLDVFANFQETNRNAQFVKLILWAIEDYPELHLIVEKRWELFDDQDISNTLIVFEKNNLLKYLKNINKNNKEKMEEIIATMITKDITSDFIKKIYENSYSELEWSNINKKMLMLVANEIIIEKIKILDELSEILTKHNHTIEIDNVINNYLIKLFEENYETKIMGLNLINNLNLKVENKSDLYFSIINHFVEDIDIETKFEIVNRLVEWLKQQKLYKASEIEIKLVEIKDSAEGELKSKYESLIKYGK